MAYSPHLTTGSQQPPRVDGKLRLYSMEFCPFAQRVRLVLNAKKIPHDIVNINLAAKPEWYFKLHPEGKVPAIDTGSEVVIESLDISDYLDEKYPEFPLYPQDPNTKKRHKELISKIGPFLAVFYKALLGQEKKSAAEWASEFVPLLEPFEAELAKTGTFFGGSKPGMVDYMLFPWGERALAAPLSNGVDIFSADKFPRLKKWREAMLQDPPANATFYKPEVHFKLVQSRLNKQTVDYDNILSTA